MKNIILAITTALLVTSCEYGTKAEQKPCPVPEAVPATECEHNISISPVTPCPKPIPCVQEVCPEPIPNDCEICPEPEPVLPVGYMAGSIVWGEEWKEHSPYSSANYIAVKAEATDGSWVRHSITDDNGEFTIEVIANSDFILSASNGNTWSVYEKTILGAMEGETLRGDPCLDAGPDMVDCS